VVVRSRIAATIGLLVSEPEVSVNAVLADCLAAKNRDLRRACRFVRPGEEAVLQPRGRGFLLVRAEKIAVTLVVVVFARLKGVEFLGKSFAQEGLEVLLCAPLGKAQRLVFGDIGVENPHGVERGLG
jgi:hypothetical protein